MDLSMQVLRLMDGRWHWATFAPGSSICSDSGVFDSNKDEIKWPASNSATAFLPQCEVLMTIAELPRGASKQQLSAIDYAIEDQLSEDIEDCFCAIGRQQADGQVPVAVINRQLMHDYVDFLVQSGLRVRSIYPEFYLCPWSNDDEIDAVICDSGDGVVIRYGVHQGMYCTLDLLASVLQMLQRSKGAEQFSVQYNGARTLPLDESSIDIRQGHHRDSLGQLFMPDGAINLKQKEFRSGYGWLEIARKWKWAMAAALLIGLAFLAQHVGTEVVLEQELEKVEAAQVKVIEPYLGSIDSGQTPKQQLIDALSLAQASGSSAGFVDALYEFTQLKSSFTAIKIEKIQFQDDTLAVNLKSANLRDLESFRTSLAQSRFPSQIENVNISPNQTTARLIMQVGES